MLRSRISGVRSLGECVEIVCSFDSANLDSFVDSMFDNYLRGDPEHFQALAFKKPLQIKLAAPRIAFLII